MTERHTVAALDTESKLDFTILGSHAEGKIEAKDNQQERLNEVTERVRNGEFHVRIEWDDRKGQMIIVQCIDGRSVAIVGPASAGGTESLVVADDLTKKRFAHEDSTMRGATENIVTFLDDTGYVIGGHSGEHGCGACGKQPEIYEIIAKKPEALQELAAQLGVHVTTELSEDLASKARARVESGQFSTGDELSSVIEAKASEKSFEVLSGEHKEVLIAVNMVSGTTLDREALVSEFGDDYQVFEVDAWAFEEAARATSLTEDEVQEKVAALTYYNLATALALCGPNMRVVTVE